MPLQAEMRPVFNFLWSLHVAPHGMRSNVLPRNMRTHCSPNPCLYLLSLFFLRAAVLADAGQYLTVAFLHTPLMDGVECFLSLLAICISSFEKRLTLSLNILKVMQTGEMKKKTKA